MNGNHENRQAELISKICIPWYKKIKMNIARLYWKIDKEKIEK